MSEIIGAPPGRLKAFAYAAAEKAPVYRVIMGVLLRAKERFVFRMRPHEILHEVHKCGLTPAPDAAEIESALEQLCEWGNLEAHPDTAEVHTVEDFYKQRHVYQITSQGESAELALNDYETGRKAELQTSALLDIRELLDDLRRMARDDAAPDPGKVHRDLLALRACFEALKAGAHTFMSMLEQEIDLQFDPDAQVDAIVARRQRLIDYLERFIAELVIATDAIVQSVRDIEECGLDRLLEQAAARRAADAVDPDPANVERIRGRVRAEWEDFRSWFASRSDRLTNADALRSRARAAIPALLSAITRINDRRNDRIDRFNDLRVLARWFAAAESDADAHRLWRTAFGLHPARHFLINDATLDEHEGRDVRPDTSWLDAPPLKISSRLRLFGALPRSGRLSRVVDRAAEKKKLAAATQDEVQRILTSPARFGAGGRMRLSDLETLESGEFELFLDLLGEAVSANALLSEGAEVLSSDGTLKVRLSPTGDARTAVIHTPEGTFEGPDFWISIEQNSIDEVTA